jgi:hypothetical protein
MYYLYVKTMFWCFLSSTTLLDFDPGRLCRSIAHKDCAKQLIGSWSSAAPLAMSSPATLRVSAGGGVLPSGMQRPAASSSYAASLAASLQLQQKMAQEAQQDTQSPRSGELRYASPRTLARRKMSKVSPERDTQFLQLGLNTVPIHRSFYYSLFCGNLSLPAMFLKIK